MTIVPAPGRTIVLRPHHGSFKAFTEEELKNLEDAFLDWLDSVKNQKRWKWRARHWIVFNLLRYTGARISEVLAVDDTRDIDFRGAEIRLVTLKRHRAAKKRAVPHSACSSSGNRRDRKNPGRRP